MFINFICFKLASIFNARPIVVNLILLQLLCFGGIVFGGEFKEGRDLLIPGLIDLFFVFVIIGAGKFGVGKDFFRKPDDWEDH